MLAHRPVSTPILRLDPESQRLWRDDEEVPLTPQCFGVLRYFMDHPRALVTKDDLLKAVWRRTQVEPGQVKQFVAELRKLLSDDPDNPRYIQTVHGRGYRFIGPCTIGPFPIESVRAAGFYPDSPTRKLESVVRSNRAGELGQLTEHFHAAQRGQTQLCVITGCSGMGKSTLAQVFTEQLIAHYNPFILRAQCEEVLRDAEPFMPLLTALDARCEERDGANLLERLRRFAPRWLMQYPGRISAAEMETLSRLHQSDSPGRMIREFTGLLESFAEERPVVLWIEDIHWADEATLNLLVHVTSQARPRRVLVLATSLPIQVLPGGHVLRWLLHSNSNSHSELMLTALDRNAVHDYLHWRRQSAGLLAGEADAQSVDAVYRRSQGHPLLLAQLAEDQLGAPSAPRSSTADATCDPEQCIPSSITHFAEQLLSRVTPDERVLLEIASVAAPRFHADALGMALGWPLDKVEAHCESLSASAIWLCMLGTRESPQGTLTGEYGFVYSLLKEAVYGCIPEYKRARLRRCLNVASERCSPVAGDTGAEGGAAWPDPGRVLP